MQRVAEIRVSSVCIMSRPGQHRLLSSVRTALHLGDQRGDDRAALARTHEVARPASAERRTGRVEELRDPPAGIKPLGISGLLDDLLHLSDELRGVCREIVVGVGHGGPRRNGLGG